MTASLFLGSNVSPTIAQSTQNSECIVALADAGRQEPIINKNFGSEVLKLNTTSLNGPIFLSIYIYFFRENWKVTALKKCLLINLKKYYNFLPAVS